MLSRQAKHTTDIEIDPIKRLVVGDDERNQDKRSGKSVPRLSRDLYCKAKLAELFDKIKIEELL